MIALGWTFPAAPVPDHVTVIALPDCAVVASTAAAAASPAARLRLQVACTQGLPAFLPVRPSDRVPVELAVDLARRHGPLVAARLAELRGLAQLSLRADWPVHSPRTAELAGSGRIWLAARAVRHATETARGEEVAEALKRIAKGTATGAAMERNRPGVVQLALLCRRDRVARTLDEIARRLGRGRWPEGTRFALAGPWPALAFAGGFDGRAPA
jgi:hypothetical protein